MTSTLKNAFRAVHRRIGGVGISFTLIVVLPASVLCFHYKPLVESIECVFLLWAVSLALMLNGQKERLKKEETEACRQKALSVVLQLEAESKGLDAATREQLEIIRDGLVAGTSHDAN